MSGHSPGPWSIDYENTNDARLIAAAPDLLELAKLYVDKTAGDCMDVPFRKACLAAIAKAEGKDKEHG